MQRVGLIGCGAIGRPVAELLAESRSKSFSLAGVLTRAPPAGLEQFYTPSFQQLRALKPDIVVEAAGTEMFSECVPACLEDRISRAASRGGRLWVASGAIGGLDALTAARESGLEYVELTQRKPPSAFGRELRIEQVMSSGTAREAALAFPQNSNFAAAIALAGIGFDRTQVTVVADPKVDRNEAQLFARGYFGEFSFSIRNIPSETNPRTARLPAFSVISALERRGSEY